MAQYTTILANEFNAIQTTVSNVLGTGSSTRGYGSTVSSSQVSTGTNITKTQFDNLKTDLDRCYGHISGGSSGATSVVVGNDIAWSNIVTYQVAATYVDTNRDSNGGTVTSSQSSKVLSAGWGNASTNRVASVNFTITFSSANAMRYYFNQNSYISLSGSGAATGGTPKSNAFGTLANGVSASVNQSNYRAGTGSDQVQTTSVTPYNSGTADGISVSLSFNGSIVQGYISCSDKGGDNNVASNVDIDLTFYINLLNISNTTGISTYTPVVSFGSWAYTA